MVLQIVIASGRWLGSYGPAVRLIGASPVALLMGDGLTLKPRKPIVNLLFTLFLVLDFRVFFLCRMGHIG